MAVGKQTFTKVPNDVMERLCRERLSGAQFAVLMLVMRRSFGYHREVAEISQKGFVEATGLGKRTVEVALADLVAKGILVRVQGSRSYAYRLADEQQPVAKPTRAETNDAQSCPRRDDPPGVAKSFNEYLAEMTDGGDARSIPSLYNEYLKEREKERERKRKEREPASQREERGKGPGARRETWEEVVRRMGIRLYV